MILWRDPWNFAALLLVVGLALFFAWARRQRARALAEFVAAPLQPTVTPDVDQRRRTLRAGLLVAAATLIVLALAGPMWGFRWEQVRREGIDLVVALDTSRSMLTTDVKPDRLARAKLAVRDLVDEARGDRLALIPFAGTAFLQCPLTLDTGAFLQSLDAVEVGIIPRGGTALGVAIDASLAAFEGREASHQAIVLITDGESHEGDLDTAVARAKERGVRIFTVGIGTTEGELIPGDRGGFWKDRKGQVVKSRLDESTLERIAMDTGGAYLHAAGAGLGLPELYRDHIATLDKRELESTLERRFEQRYQLPLALAFLLLLIEPLVGERRVPAGGRRPRWRRGTAAAVVLAVVSVGWLDPHARAREGNRLYEAGKYDEAVEHYNEALVDEPDSSRLHFNLGDARYKSGKYDDALASFGKVTTSDSDPARTARVAYNVGNTKVRQGEAVEATDPQKTLDLWTEALLAYRRALGADPDDADAKWNHELVERKIAALRKKLEEQQRQDEQQKQKQGDQQKQDEQSGQGQQQREQDREQQQREAQQGQQPQDQQEADQQQGPQPGEEEQAKRDTPEHGEGNAEDRAPSQQARQQGEDGGQAQERQQDRPEAARAGAGGEREMTSEEAAALLDAQRAQEVTPGEIAARQQKARVAEPAEDW